MFADDYQKETLVTWNKEQSIQDQRLNAALGLGESGEAQNLIKKFIFHGHSLDTNELVKELGDNLYYISIMAYLFGVDLSQVMEANIVKLRKRYNGGAFSKELSINRKD